MPYTIRRKNQTSKGGKIISLFSFYVDGQLFNGESKDYPAELKTTVLIIVVPLFQSEISRPGS